VNRTGTCDEHVSVVPGGLLPVNISIYGYALILATYEFDNAASYYPALKTWTDILETNNESSFHQYECDYDEQGDHWG
jgi:hypothetical protein